MMRRLGPLVLALAAAACGTPRDRGHDAGTDAGPPPDAGPERCLRGSSPGEEPDSLERCGICLEPHARWLAPNSLASGRGWAAAPVPGGLVVAMMTGGVTLVFVTESGEVVPAPEQPWADHPDPFQYGNVIPQLAPVPGTTRVWVVSTWQRARLLGPGPGWTDVVLYEVTPDGWERVAAIGGVRRLVQPYAYPNGDMLAWGVREIVGGAIYYRARALPDGTVDLIEKTADDDDDFDSIMWWAFHLDSGDMGVVCRQTPVEDRSTIHESWLLVVDSELNFARPPRRLGPAYDDPAYMFDPELMIPLNPRHYSAYQRPDGTAVVMMAGTRADSGGARMSELWIQRIGPDGELAYPIPGIPANPTEYVRREDLPGGDGFQLPFARPLGDAGDAVIWNEIEYGNTDGNVRAQVVDLDGNRVFPEALRMVVRSEAGLRLWTSDGTAESYLGRAEFREDVGTERVYSVVKYDGTMDWAWPDRVYVQTCEPRVAEPGLMVVGAYEDGVWVLWDDRQPDVNGALQTIAKVALVRSDGTFAWGP